VIQKEDYKIFSKKELVVLLIMMALSVLICFVIVNNIPTWIPGRLFRYKGEFLGIVFTFIGLFWSLYGINVSITRKYGCFPDRWKRCLVFIENKSLLILSIFVVLTLVWLGLVIFNNPYLVKYNQGNGAYFAHVLHNLCNGIGPEETTKANGSLFYLSNPYFFTSVFSVSPQILGYFLLAPLYCLYPYPPMHIYSMAIVVVLFGTFGVYLAIQALGGSKIMSLLGAMGYSLIPWVELPILYHGNFDNLGYAVYPYVFAFLFSQRWRLFYISLFLLAMISIPYTYSVMGLGVVVALFFKAPKQGIITFIIGFMILQWDMAVVRQSLCGIWDSGTQYPGLFAQLVLGCDIKTLIKPFLFQIIYIFTLLLTVSFLPLYGVRRQKKWNWPIIGMLLFALIGASMGLFRSWHWFFHRNSNLVVPIYLSAFMAYISIRRLNEERNKGHEITQREHILIGILLFSSITSITLWCPSHSHYPWVALRSLNNPLDLIKPLPNNQKFTHILTKINELVPNNASVAYRVDMGLEAFVANRHKAWEMGYNPEGVEYYIVQTRSINQIDTYYPKWQERLEKLEDNKNYKLLYKNDVLVIYKNLKPEPIPRLESVLGWDVLWKALIPGTCEDYL